MSASKYNIIIEQGADFALQLTMKEDDVAKDLTGYTGRSQMRAPIGNDSITATFTVTIVSPETSGVITMGLTSTITAALTPGLYFYDLEIVLGSVVTRLLQGTAEVTGEVTR